MEPLIFLSDVKQPPAIDPGTAKRVVLRGTPGAPDDAGLIGMLLRADELGFNRRGPIDPAIVRTLTRAIEQAGIRPPGRGRRVGDYELAKLLTEGENWQDFAAKHAATGVARRVRIYPYARAASPEARDRLARIAQREFRVLEGVEHQGIQRVLDYREAEQGPALIFEHDPRLRSGSIAISRRSTRPSHSPNGSRWSVSSATRWHSPMASGCITAALPRRTSWSATRTATPRGCRSPTGRSPAAGKAAAPAWRVTTGTQHVDEYLSDPAKLYRAPEADEATDLGAAQADVFSLGAIAYHIFAGRPPANSPLDLSARLREGNGLRLSGAINGVGGWLEEMVRVATAPVVRDRPRDAREFLDYLAEAEKEALPPEPAPPPRRRSSDRRARRSARRRPDRGQAARPWRQCGRPARTARRTPRKKSSSRSRIDAAHGDRIRAEAEVLRRLHHQNIVRFVAETTVAERPAILMERAGDKTLAQWIRGSDTLSLDLMRRFGENLLSAVEHLEQEGVAHRDIKPNNIGIAKAAGTGAYRLVLFDFSLSRAPTENIQAGTRPYLDPFLADRKPPRWDLHAERYAAAVTLHEMLAGTPPVFGDGLTDPRVTER